MIYLTVAYGLIAIVLSGYGLSIWRRWRLLQSEMRNYSKDVH